MKNREVSTPRSHKRRVRRVGNNPSSRKRGGGKKKRARTTAGKRGLRVFSSAGMEPEAPYGKGSQKNSRDSRSKHGPMPSMAEPTRLHQKFHMGSNPMAQQQIKGMWHLQRLKSNTEGQLDGVAGRMRDLPVLDPQQPGVLIERTKEPRLRSSQRAVPRKRRNGDLWKGSPPNVAWE